MKQYISEDRAIYEDMYHGEFSKRLAEWAISKMMKKEPGTDTLKPIMKKTPDETMKILKQFGANIQDKSKYTAWYLWHMALADYQNALPTDERRSYFVYETIYDPDGCTANVLDCFVTKMCNAGEPIYWEEML
jgi:hypothetical protein